MHCDIRQVDYRLVAVRFGFHTNLDLVEIRSGQVVVRVANLEWNVAPKVVIQFRNANAGGVWEAKWGVHRNGYEMTAIGQEILLKFGFL